MAAMEVNLYKGPMDFVFKSTAGPVGKHMGRIGKSMVSAAKSDVAKVTGRLANSISSEVVASPGGPLLIVKATAPHALMHHEGTRPHIIAPRGPKILRFNKGGSAIFADVVHHPGTKPHPFLSDKLVLARV